jgi:iron(III) transport system substrate-binding protein
MINPFLNHVGEAQKKGAPIDVAMADPVPYTASPIMLAKLAPHPHAAMLLIDFLLSPPAQEILAQKGYYPAHPDVAPKPEMRPFLPKTHGLKKFLVDESELARMAPATDALMKRLFE